MSVKFKIVVPSYNCVDWISECLQSLEDQTYKNYDALIIDDASNDQRQCEIIEKFACRNGWKTLFRSQHCGAMENIVEGIRHLNCSPEDVIFILDGDDWFYDSTSLLKLYDVYAKGNVDLTYGQFKYYPSGRQGSCRPVPQEIKESRNYRRMKWCFYQPRSFKHFLWSAIRDEDLRDPQGNYVSVAYDVAMMFPLLEMAGERFKFIDEILYVYNMANPINDYKIHKKLLRSTEHYLRQKPKYDVLKGEDSR